MAEEPQPRTTEAQNAAASLSNLDAPHASGAGNGTKAADPAALTNAVSSLSVADKASDGAGSAASKEEVKKKIKIDAEDVAFLVDQLEVTKLKATEMLRSHGGDRREAVRAFVLASA